MPEFYVVVSDLHIGRMNNQDDFRDPKGQTRATAFETFCRRIVDIADGRKMTVVLNGDVFDFWELAEEEELSSHNAFEAICRNVVFSPALIAADPNRATRFTQRQLEWALDAHPAVASALRYLLGNENISLVYLYGNHDHAMRNPALQSHLRDLLGDIAQDTGRFHFDHFLEDEDLKVYIEHGNQFAKEESRFRHVDNWEEEALGYYPLRFIWNRYQAKYQASAPTILEGLGLILRVIRHGETERDLNVIQYVVDYFRAFLPSSGIPKLVPEIVSGFGLKPLFTAWLDNGSLETADVFLARLFKRTLDEEPAVSFDLRPSEAIMDAKYDWPGDPSYPEIEEDRYAKGLRDRHDGGDGLFPRLEVSKHHSLFLGHTHRHLAGPLFPGDPFPNQVYINTGSWTEENKTPIYGYVDASGTRPKCGLRRL